jgi:uncharacterized membrane protein YfcA
MIPLTGPEYALVLVAVTAGAAVQGSVGFGANLLAVPVLALVEPRALPATLTMWVLPLAVAMAVRERHGIDRPGALLIVAWRIPGTVVGALTVAAVSADAISALAGGAVLAAVAVTASGVAVPVNRATTAAAGLASGAMGTATSIGGPPVALLYQRREGPVLRSTLAVTFVAGLLISLLGQTAVGAVSGWHVLVALSLVPGTVAGLGIAHALAGRLDGPWLRPTVLTLAGITGLVALVRGLT